MPPPDSETLARTIKDLSEQVYRPLDMEHLPESARGLALEASPPADPDLSEWLDQCFQRTAGGRTEALRMELDVLRRLSRCRETERVFRAFGVLNLATPVRHRGRTVHAYVTGPLKVGPWTDREKQTLARLCGLKMSQLPPELDRVAVFHPTHVEALVRAQEEKAALLGALLDAGGREEAAAAETPALGGAGLDLLQPGFADHLDMLFGSIQSQTAPGGDFTETARGRVQLAARRGRHLAEQIRRLSAGALSGTRTLSVHALLEQWSQSILERQPTVRFSYRFEAQNDQVNANPHALNHLLYTLLAGVADGLPEGAALLGVGTRDGELRGKPCLHLEIRDSGGLATFAGVETPLGREILGEQNQAAEEYADWLMLAEQIDADLNILRDDGVVTRVELFLPLRQETPTRAASAPPSHRVWVVEDDDRDYETLRRMLAEDGVDTLRLTSAAALREQYPLAPESPELVIMKYNLPDQRGAALRTWLYEQDSDLPVILVSSFSATHPGIATAGNLPSTLYLQKPFDSQALLDMLRMTLDDTLPGT